MNRAVFDADHEALRASVARFFAAEHTGGFWAAAAEHGFVGLGAEDDPRFAAVVLEEAMVAGLPHVALAVAMHDGFALPLLASSSSANASPGLVAVVDGAPVRATSTPDGWRLEGTAGSVVNGLGADTVVVAAQPDQQSDRVLVVPAAAVGRDVSEPLLGLEDLDLADLRFDDVAASSIAADLAAARARHQVALAVAAMAGARTALRITVSYVQERKAFGKPISTFENTRHALGTLGARIAAVGTFVDSCLLSAPTPHRAAAAKLTASEVLGDAVDLGVQLHGGYGYMWEYPISRAYAAARFFRLHGGSTADLDALLAPAVGL